MSIELSKIPQSVERSDIKTTFAFTEGLNPENTKKLANLFAGAFNLRLPYKI